MKDIFPSNIKILYNTFEGCTYRAIRVFKFRDVLIEGNTFKDCFGSINVGASSNDSQAGDTILINNNKFDGATGNVSPISINGVTGALTKNVKVINNTFKNLSNVNGGAIYLNFSTSVFVSYNHFFDISRALWVQNSENVTFESNKTDVTSLELVYAQSTKNFNCIGNTVKETKRIGINLDGIIGGNVRNNSIEKSGTETSNTRSGILLAVVQVILKLWRILF